MPNLGLRQNCNKLFHFQTAESVVVWNPARFVGIQKTGRCQDFSFILFSFTLSSCIPHVTIPSERSFCEEPFTDCSAYTQVVIFVLGILKCLVFLYYSDERNQQAGCGGRIPAAISLTYHEKKELLKCLSLKLHAFQFCRLLKRTLVL